MIQHIVMLRLPDDHDPAVLAAVMDGLKTLELPGFTGFRHGPNRDYEDKSGDYPYGFICTFDTKDALQNYADHPDHRTLGAQLVALCGGADAIMVIDLEVPAP
jgi:hypothetical protein